jgi:hypothetical protein
MSFWLSAIPVQNCSLNLNVDSQKTREIKAPPTVQINAGSYDTHATHPHTPHSPLRIVATAREVVQEESRTYSEMTRCVRLFHNTLFPCGSLTHEGAVSEDALSGHQRIRFSIPTAANFHERPRNGMGADCLK